MTETPPNKAARTDDLFLRFDTIPSLIVALP